MYVVGYKADVLVRQYVVGYKADVLGRYVGCWLQGGCTG
jgi:hypothetical protein